MEEAGSPPPDKKLVQAMKTMREELVLAGKEDAAAERGEGVGDRGPQVAEAEAALRRACLNAERRQGLTLDPNSAQLELFCPPYNPT